MNTHLFVLPFLHFGVGRLATDLMLAARAAGGEVVAITCGWSGEFGDDADLVKECRAAGVRFGHADVFAREPEIMAQTALTIDRLCATWEPLVAHAFTAIAAAAIRQCPVVASVVGWSPAKAPWQRAMDVAILDRCAVVTAVSEAVTEDLRAAGLQNVPLLVRNGVRVADGIAGRHNRTGAVGAVAQLIPRKGIDVLLQAMAVLPRGTFERVRIAGSGESEEALKQLARDLAMPCAVEWCGHVRLQEFFPTIDALAIPSRSDALPMVLLEAMAAGVPVVATRSGGIPEALQPDEGWLVESGDVHALAAALREVACNPSAAASRAARAHARAREAFSLDRMVARYFECYAKAAEVASQRA